MIILFLISGSTFAASASTDAVPASTETSPQSAAADVPPGPSASVNPVPLASPVRTRRQEKEEEDASPAGRREEKEEEEEDASPAGQAGILEDPDLGDFVEDSILPSPNPNYFGTDGNPRVENPVSMPARHVVTSPPDEDIGLGVAPSASSASPANSHKASGSRAGPSPSRTPSLPPYRAPSKSYKGSGGGGCGGGGGSRKSSSKSSNSSTPEASPAKEAPVPPPAPRAAGRSSGNATTVLIHLFALTLAVPFL